MEPAELSDSAAQRKFNRQSSVMDRIRWIEQAHGPSQNTQPRTRPRPPQLLADTQPASPSAADTFMKECSVLPTPVSGKAAPGGLADIVTSPAAPQAADDAGHVWPPAEQQQQQQQPPPPAEDAESSGHSRTTSEASDRDFRSAVDLRKSLGGIRSRAPPAASRRYNKSQAAAAAAAEAAESESSEAPVHDKKEQADRPRQPKAPSLRETRSMGNVKQASDGGRSRSEGLSLLSRLAVLTANRPNVQDLVNNRQSPKFVKRSHHYSASPAADSPGASITWGRYEKRYR